MDRELKGLRIFDEPIYMKPILTKLPDNVQGTWQRHAYRYKVQWSVEYPPFSEFARFIQDIARERNDPYMATETSKTGNPQPPKPAFRPARNSNLRQVLVSKVDVLPTSHQPTTTQASGVWYTRNHILWQSVVPLDLSLSTREEAC